MAQLTGNPINTSYQGILKTLDNAAINGTNRVISDGVGNALPLEASTTTIKFTGNADFTSATVTGLDTGGGLAAGTGTDSIASVLTSSPATASNNETIAIGKGALANQFNANAFGSGASATGGFAQALGTYCEAGGSYGVAVGTGCNASGEFALAVGKQSTAPGAKGIAIGAENTAQGQYGIAIGYQVTSSFFNDNIGIGRQADPNYVDSIAIGKNAEAGTGSKSDAIAIGRLAKALETDAIALGQGVEATTANTVTIKKLQLLDYATLNYADDAAAATGNIPLGGVYHTSGALKIRIA